MKGKTFLLGVLLLLVALAAWLAWQTKNALDAKADGTWVVSPQSRVETPAAR